MALPLDNPSYFTVSSGSLPCPGKGKFRLFKKKMGANVSAEVDLMPKITNGKMQLRTLLRSVSSNSADSTNQELLVLGEPRPSDIAPPSPYLSSHRDRDAIKKRSLRRNISNPGDLIYSPLATSEEAADEIDFSEDETEVFLSDDTAKYYNLAAVSQQRREQGRRHSIGTYLQERERALSATSSNNSFKEEPPLATVHATNEGEIVKPTTPTNNLNSDGKRQRQTSRSRRRCNCCNARGAGCSASCPGMDDVLIVSSRSSPAAALWVNYFGTCFDQQNRQKDKQSLKVFNLRIEEVNEISGISSQLEQRVSDAKLYVVIVCPHLLDYVASQPRSSAALCNLLRPDRTIAMLLGVTDDDLTDVHHASLVSYRQWQRHPVGQDQDLDFARDFMAASMGIVTKVARQQQAAALEERATFSVMPKKVKQSQTRLLVLLVEPLNKDDIIRVSVDKNGELIEVKPVNRRNPYTLKFTMPNRCLEVSSIVNILVEKNGIILGTSPVKCENRLRELDQILRSINDPVEFMCQTLGFTSSDHEQLDNWMVHSFQTNLPPHFNLVATTAAPGASSRGSNGSSGGIRQTTPARHLHGQEKYPTLLHFAAKYGMERLAWQLLECPGGDTACELRNACDLTPAEMAENAGHSKLASALKGYMQMNEFTSMYSQLKELSQTKAASQAPDVDEDEYLLPRSVDMTYSIPPPARPYPQSGQSNLNCPIAGYLEMQPSRPTNTPTPGRVTPTGKTILAQKHNESESKFTDIQQDTNRSESSNVNPDKVQDELLEIINDFKNSVFTLPEVEKLVDEWRNRNDVQRSFKEKEDQLNVMRRQYERLQQQMKDEMKQPTPLDKIKRLFSRSSKNKQEACLRDAKFEVSLVEDKNNNDGASTSGQNRPISSLSLQSTTSSSSSGRLSTLSAYSTASFGDSGTHSDHEDRKRQTSCDHEYLELDEPKKNYLVPLAPKPYKNTPGKLQQFSTIIERPPHPNPRIDPETEGNAYYIQFPPSGLPVEAALLNGIKLKLSQTSSVPIDETDIDYIAPNIEEHQNEYINICSQLPEYINFQPPNTDTPALPPRT